MKITNKIKNYLFENDFKIIITNNGVDIINYKEIGHFDSNTINIKCDNKIIIVKGTDLVTSKMVKDEVLIVGNIINIEFR